MPIMVVTHLLERRNPHAPVPLVVALMTESILIGVYGVIVGLVVWILKKNYSTMSLMLKLLFGSSITMFLIAAAHLGLLLQETIVNFQGPVIGKVAVILALFQFLISDLVFIWRVWVIWNRNYWIVILPIILLVAEMGCFAYVAANTEKTASYSTAATALLIANTCVCTFLIIFRIWYMRYTMMRLSGGRIRFCLKIFKGGISLIIESGALFTLSLVISLILYYVHPGALVVMANLEMPLVGILPSLILILVHFNKTSETRRPDGDTKTISFWMDTCFESETLNERRHDMFGAAPKAEDKNTPREMSLP